METRPEKSQALTRLALCVILAVGLYAGAGKLPQLEPWREWLEGHKIEAIAAAAAVLIPALELALGDVLPNATVGLLGCAAFFVPILVAGKPNE